MSEARGSVGDVNADPADQRKLLDLADLDARIHRDEKVAGNPPQAERVRELIARRATLTQELSTRANSRDDINAELKRLESDVAVVDARIARDTERLAASSNPKQAQGFESELTSLKRRKSDLEDMEIALMERLEAADAAVAEQEAVIADTNAQGAQLSAEAKTTVTDATTRLEGARRDRDAVAASVPADLLGLYERLASRGNGAGLLRAGACEACRMVLPPSDLAVVRRAQTDEVVFCPECGAILVRTEESR
jgi:predicted  nucleic acid-binding Zn-ribbon protein